jgi:hypothetical protein
MTSFTSTPRRCSRAISRACDHRDPDVRGRGMGTGFDGSGVAARNHAGRLWRRGHSLRNDALAGDVDRMGDHTAPDRRGPWSLDATRSRLDRLFCLARCSATGTAREGCGAVCIGRSRYVPSDGERRRRCAEGSTSGEWPTVNERPSRTSRWPLVVAPTSS